MKKKRLVDVLLSIVEVIKKIKKYQNLPYETSKQFFGEVNKKNDRNYEPFITEAIIKVSTYKYVWKCNYNYSMLRKKHFSKSRDI